MYRLILAGLLLAVNASPASATKNSNSASTQPSLDVETPFDVQRHAIEQKLADGKTYTEISVNDRSMVREALSRISNTLGMDGSVDSLSETQKASVFNDQELINTILTKASVDSRVVCEQVTQVGSHRKVSVCKTVAERRRIREEAQDNLRSAQRPTVLKSN
jgi:hypothetical protein